MSTIIQRRVFRAIDRLAHFTDARSDAGRSLVMHDAYRLDRVLGVGRQPRFDRGGIGAVAPVAGDELGHQAELLRHRVPQRREMSGLAHQYTVAGRQRVDERGFPRAGAGCGKNDDRRFGFEDLLQAGEHFLAELLEAGAAMIDRRVVDRAQHAVGHIGRARDLQKMASVDSCHGGLAGEMRKKSNHGD